MRLGTSQSARPTPIDRVHTNVSKSNVALATAPHGLTQRWTYTVPAGKKANIQVVRAYSHRATAAAPSAGYECFIAYTPSGGSQMTLMVVTSQDNTAVVYNERELTMLGDMDAGDQIQAITDDLSTGGTVDLASAAKIYEYDA